jgi:integral membrane protein (TIGR00529 family)
MGRVLPLYGSLFGGSVIIGLWMSRDVSAIPAGIWQEVSSPSCLWLSLVISLILVLSDLLSKSGRQDRIVSSFQAVSPDRRFTLAALPALIGLLPMPGGALFSAPMVESATGSDQVEPELKVAINYWFRHLWEYWWPLYPGIILSISLFAVAPWKLMALQVPLTVGAVVGGVIFILSCLPPLQESPTSASWSGLIDFGRETLPISVVILVMFGLQALVGGIEYVNGISLFWPPYLSLTIALASSLILVTVSNSVPSATVKSAFLNAAILRMVLIVFGIMAFKGMLVKSGAIEQVRTELVEYHIPALLIIGLLPFVAGIVTGIAIGFVGVSFPLVVALIPAGQSPFPYAVLAYGCGYMGMMLSPLHLCLVVSKEYFRADLVKGYGYLWKPILFGLAWTFLLFVLYRKLF